MADGDHAPVLPQNVDAEESIIGAMLMSEMACDVAAEEVTRQDFYRGSLGEMFEAMCEMREAGVPVDAITLGNDLEGRGRLADLGGKERLHELATIVPATSNVRHYCVIVRKHATRRALVNAGHWIQDFGWNGTDDPDVLVEKAEEIVFNVAQSRSVRRSDLVSVSDTMIETFRRIEELHERGADVVGLTTGMRPLDQLTSGFQPSNLIVLAARPSMGKSALAVTIGANVAVKQRIPVAVFSMEMSKHELTQRILSAEAMVDSTRIRNGRLDVEAFRRLYDAQKRIHEAPLYVDDLSAQTIGEIRSKSRKFKMRNPGLGLIIVDYLQLMQSGTRFENRVQEVSQISRGLKQLASELEVPVLALSQLSRAPEQRHDRRPILSDLRESGSIEQDADLVAFLYRDEYYNPETAAEDGTEGVAELNLAKQRNGPTGLVKLAFVSKFAMFSGLE